VRGLRPRAPETQVIKYIFWNTSFKVQERTVRKIMTNQKKSLKNSGQGPENVQLCKYV
jgi:hypothetical protein